MQETILPEDVDLNQVKELVKLVEEHNLAELTVEENGITITVKGAVEPQTYIAHVPQMAVVSDAAHADPSETHEEPAVEPVEEEADDANLYTIEAPMVGVFYRAQSPDSPPFVEVGDMIEIGQTIGLIEAMKVFSEIPSEIAGEVVDIPAENGKLVQQGQPLIIVRPS